MLGLRRGTGLAAVALMFAAVMVPEVAAKRYTVGDGGLRDWVYGANYSLWTNGKHFYKGDWLYFVYDRYQYQVLEVNNSTYYDCSPFNSTDPSIKNFTGGAGRDVVALNETRDYYFISSSGYCSGGMKLLVHVEKPPPQPLSPPSGSGSHSSLDSNFRARALVPALFAAAAVWDSLVLLL